MKLVLTSNDGVQSGPTGYDRLSKSLKDVEICSTPRVTSNRFFLRLARFFMKKKAGSQWVMKSSRDLENLAKGFIQRNKIELVHMFWADRDWYQIDKICRSMKVPLVCTVHACPGDLPGIFIDTKRLNDVDHYIFMSSHQKEFFIKNGVPEEKLSVVPHGVDIDYFSPIHRQKSASDKKFTILSVGHTRRNFPLMQAIIEKLETQDAYQFNIVTNDSFRASFESYKNVVFKSGISNEELRDEYLNADILLLTADDTTANNALMEALSCGLPIVGENVGGIPEYVNADAAILCKPNDIDSIIQEIEHLLGNSELRASMALAARKRAEELSWERVGALTMETYEKIIKAT